jgi:hypothetical protein
MIEAFAERHEGAVTVFVRGPAPSTGPRSFRRRLCYPKPMKFVEPTHLGDPDAAARRLVEITNAVEAVQDGRVYIEQINGPFLEEGGTPDRFRAALARAIALGWLWRHESGTYVKFTPAGAEMFA